MPLPGFGARRRAEFPDFWCTPSERPNSDYMVLVVPRKDVKLNP